ncbi:hypothetical protein KW849_14405 [Pseudomonas sp. PDM26]|uniref:hypothetical protein n=1 Tax=Pseudomonas sp. PDM26 TaxID=2854766 RepID=UPI001C4883CA|nr:hypothetical protein [Pseudomonas sp. PDM26]MBV7547480.1 hypothetical protein [Pseudomonas sp. PDM26]
MRSPVTIEQMILEGSCTTAWAANAGYKWDALVIGGDALAKRKWWLAAQAFNHTPDA